MKRTLIYLTNLLVLCLLFSCENENMEDKYFNTTITPGDTTSQNINKKSEILWLPFEGNVNDSTDNNTPAVFVGEEKFVNGLNDQYGKGLYLNGESYLLINLGYYDTLSIAMWIKGEGELDRSYQPVIFDYGQNAISAQLDAITGATALTVKKKEQSSNSRDNSNVEYLNSYNRYSFIYIEAGGDKTEVYFKGYAQSGDEKIYYKKVDLSGIVEAESEILYIGRSSERDNQTASYFRGAIDEIHIFNRTLTQAEIEKMASIPTK